MRLWYLFLALSPEFTTGKSQSRVAPPARGYGGRSDREVPLYRRRRSRWNRRADSKIPAAVNEIMGKPMTHVVYSHAGDTNVQWTE